MIKTFTNEDQARSYWHQVSRQYGPAACKVRREGEIIIITVTL